ARLIGRDDASDIAVLKIAAPAPLPHVRWADSERAKVGDWVVAVGNPFGLGGTVTAGIISALGRDIDDGPYDDFLQIDAPINRGNSGGPTFDLDGRVLGINTAIFSPSGGSIGIGFAIPAKLASRIVRQLIAQGIVDHGWLGVTIQNVTPSIAGSFAIDPQQPVGALVDDVARGSPAARAGLRQGDVILAVGRMPVEAAHDLRRLVDQSGIGARVPLRVRRGGRDSWLTAVIGAAPETTAPETAGEGSSEPPRLSLGLELDPLTPQLRQALALPYAVRGVLVVGVASGGAGDLLGLEVGDVIVAVSKRTVATPGDAARRLDAALAEGQVLVLVNRHGASHFLGVARDRSNLITSP
ncbi:MAG: trypsin-like peptidase domain-containing protein, partial [Stellaceae bacterium]